MRALRRALILAASGLAACSEPVGPPGDRILTGSWATQCCIPSGSYTQFTLTAAGGRIDGSGDEQRLCCWHDTFAVAGQYDALFGSFALDLSYSKGQRATYVGAVFHADSLVGFWSDSASAAPVRLVFHRAQVQIAPLVRPRG